MSGRIYCIATILRQQCCIATIDDSHARQAQCQVGPADHGVRVRGRGKLAENCHRIDLGAPDDNVVAAAPACDARATLYGWDRPSVMIVDEGFQVASDDAGPPAPQSGCAEQ
jgi:hypothetical protein